MSELWAHQKKAVEMARGSNNLAILYEPGTGKTRTLIEILKEECNTKKRIVNTLIFAPLSVCYQWKKEFLTFSRIDPNRVLVLTGSGKSREEEIKKIIANKMGYVVVTNYESVQMDSFYSALLKWSPEIVVSDESHRLKDSTSKRAKKIYTLSIGARRRFILTGTLTLNSMLDVFGQYKFLNPTLFGPHFTQFRNKYFYNKNANAPSHVTWPDWVPQPTAAKMIGAVLSKTSVQAKKEDCIDLPPLIQIKLPVEMSGPQGKAYWEMEKQFLTELEGRTTIAEFAMTKGLRLQQILSGFIAPDQEDPVLFKDVPRLKVLSDTLETIGTEKVIIWTIFRPSYKQIEAICKDLKLKCTFLTGEQTITEKNQAVEDFCRGDVQVLISNPSAGGTGINLTEAKYAIYYMRGYSLEHFLQSQARNFRAGSTQHDKVVHYTLYTPGTIDEVIGDALDNKQSVGEKLLEWARKQNG